MLGSIQEHIQFLLLAFSSLIFIVDPIATIPTFLVLTADAEMRRAPPHGETSRLDLFRGVGGLCDGGHADLQDVRNHTYRPFGSPED